MKRLLFQALLKEHPLMYIRDFLESRHVWFERLLHCPAPSATKRAQSIHISGRQVAKGVLVKGAHGDVLAVLPATHRVDLDRLAEVLEEKSVDLRIATEDEVEQIFADCERGALPPFGQLYGLKTVVDDSLTGASEFVFLSNVRHEGMRMRYRDYEAIEAPVRGRIAMTGTSPGRMGGRWAG
jgi:Ala-tRNA(Pro) deacylase